MSWESLKQASHVRTCLWPTAFFDSQLPSREDAESFSEPTLPAHTATFRTPSSSFSSQALAATSRQSSANSWVALDAQPSIRMRRLMAQNRGSSSRLLSLLQQHHKVQHGEVEDEQSMLVEKELHNRYHDAHEETVLPCKLVRSTSPSLPGAFVAQLSEDCSSDWQCAKNCVIAKKKREGDEVASKVSKLSYTCFQYTYITKRRMNTVSTMLRISGTQSKRRQEAHEKCTGLPTRAARTAARLAATLWTPIVFLHSHLSTMFTLKNKNRTSKS